VFTVFAIFSNKFTDNEALPWRTTWAAHPHMFIVWDLCYHHACDQPFLGILLEALIPVHS
jgi:hypothetical protein